MKDNYIDVGQIVNTHGLRGEIKINTRTDYPDFFEEIDGVYTSDGTYYQIDNVKYHKKAVILKLKGIDSIADAEKMRMQVLYVEKEFFDSLPDGTYLICDMIGLEVKYGETSLGTITDVMQTGSNDVYVAEAPGKKAVLIPALKDVIKEVNIKEKYMLVELPEGLLD